VFCSLRDVFGTAEHWKWGDLSGGNAADTVERLSAPGRAVQVDPIEPTLIAPETNRLKLQYDGLLSNFAFKFNLRSYTRARASTTPCRYTTSSNTTW